MKKITILTFVLCLIAASNAMAADWYVKADATGANDGTSLADAFITFDLALAASGEGDTIFIDGEVSHSAASADVAYNLTIVGQNSAKLVGTGNGRLINFVGIFTLNISNVTFENFVSAAFSGVLSVWNGATLIIDNCAFINNKSTRHSFTGGAIYLGGNANGIIKNSLFKGNSASGINPNTLLESGRGGAIMAYSNNNVAAASLSITNSTFYDNSATERGGAISVWYGTNGGSFNAKNITVAKNSSESASNGYSGGIRLDGTLTATIENSLIFDNLQDSTGANTPMNIGSTAAARPTITNSIVGVINSTDGTITNSVVNLDVADLTLDYTDIAAGTDEVVKYADATYPVNFGDPSLLSPIVTDQKGTARDTADGKIDAGAWASGLPNPIVLSVSSNEFENDLRVYYSASSKTITISNVYEKIVSVDVYNILGAKALSHSKIDNKAIIEAGTLKSGIYILMAKSSEGKSVTKKFIVNN